MGIDRDAAGEFGKFGGRKESDSTADIQGDINSIPFPDESQEFVIARHVLEHMIDPLVTLKEWRRVLKPGGRMSIAVPNHDAYDTMIIDASHVHAYTAPSLRNILEAAGLEVEAIDFPPPPTQSIVAQARKLK